MSGPVHIVAVGARTPVGSTAETTAAAVRARICRLVLHPFMADQENSNITGGLDTSFDPGIVGTARLLGLARSALDELMNKLAPISTTNVRIRLLLALPETRPGFEDSDARFVEAQLHNFAAGYADVHVRVFARGHAGGLHALAEAARCIDQGQQDIFVIGGVDSYFDFDTLDWLQEHRQLMNEVSRSGFAPGEAAGFIALVGVGTLRKLRLTSLGVLRGWGVSKEEKLIKTDAINLGEGLARAISEAVGSLRLPQEAADTVLCDINGERYRVEEWGFALMRVHSAVRDTSSIAPVEHWGDVGAASGPLLCNLAVQAWARGYARGPRALIWAGSEQGLRAAVLLEAPGADRG